MLSEWKWTLFEQSTPFLLNVCPGFSDFVLLLVKAVQPWHGVSGWITGLDVFACRLYFEDLYHYGWPPLPAVCFFFLVGWMDGKKREWGDSRRDGLTTHSLSLSIHLSLSHFESQHLISSHMLSHWVRNQSFSLLLSLPIYLCHCLCHFILAIFYQSNMLAVGTNEPVSLQSRSNHTTSSLGLY